MNPYSGELKSTLSDLDRDFQSLPASFDHAAKCKLNGNKTAMVSLTSGGKLSKHAAKLRRKAAKASRKRNRVS